MKGFERAVQSMSLGERASVKVPSKLAYGCDGKGKVPPDTDLDFDLHLLGIDKKYAKM